MTLESRPRIFQGQDGGRGGKDYLGSHISCHRLCGCDCALRRSGVATACFGEGTCSERFSNNVGARVVEWRHVQPVEGDVSFPSGKSNASSDDLALYAKE